jgi:hypothetical protein
MGYIIVKDVRGNKYYAKFTSHPIHYRSYSWQGLKNNATVFLEKDQAQSAFNEAQRRKPETLEIIRS